MVAAKTSGWSSSRSMRWRLAGHHSPRPPGRCALRRCGRTHPLAPLAWPDSASALPDPAHPGGCRSDDGGENRSGQIGDEADEGIGRAGDLRVRPRRSDHRLCIGSAGRRAVFHLANGGRCAVVAASPDGGSATNAMVATRRSFDASGQDRHRQRHARRGSPRHPPASLLVSHGSMTAPMFGTVSTERRTHRHRPVRRRSPGAPIGRC